MNAGLEMMLAWEVIPDEVISILPANPTTGPS